MLEWKLTTSFTGGEKDHQLTVRLGPKNGRFTFFIPARGSCTGKQAQIGFRTGGMEGLTLSFGNFLRDRLQREMKKWKKVAKMRDWTKGKAAWRDAVRKLWENRQKRCTRKRKLELV